MGEHVEVLNSEGMSHGSIELPAYLFDAEVSEHALYRAVTTYLANQRQGNASTKSRSEVRRTGKKHHRQKGIGIARRGSLGSPLLRGGGVAFGPKPRSYHSNLPKLLKRLAFRSALTLKRQSGSIKVVEDFDFSEPSTKSFLGIINACGLGGRKLLFVTPGSIPVLVKSCRNLPGVQIRPAASLCTYDVVDADALLITRKGLEVLSLSYVNSKGGAERG